MLSILSSLWHNGDMLDRLPNAENARIDPRKLRDYALNSEHSTGRFKARFFAQMGYRTTDWELLEQDIRSQHLSQPADEGQPSPFGQKYTITAPLQGPSGPARQVTSVWIIRHGEAVPDMVTIEPATRSKVSYKMDRDLELLDTVIALSNFPEHRVLAGDLGSIVEVYNAPVLAYEVEFVNPDGTTRALLTLSPHQVRRLSGADVLTTRQLPLAA